MRILNHAYRFISNFLFLALVYYSLNFMEKYPQRATLAILVLVYAAMRAATVLRSFYFFQRIERLEFEARRLAGLTGEGPAALSQRKQIVTDVTALASCRRDQFLYRPAVSGDDRAAVHLEDRDELRLCSVSGESGGIRCRVHKEHASNVEPEPHALLFLTCTRCFSAPPRPCAALRVPRPAVRRTLSGCSLPRSVRAELPATAEIAS